MTGKFWIKAALAEFLVWIGYLIYVGHYLFNSSPALPYGPAWLHFILFPLALAGWDLTCEKIDGLFLKPGYSLVNGYFYLRKIFKLAIILYFATVDCKFNPNFWTNLSPRFKIEVQHLLY